MTQRHARRVYRLLLWFFPGDVRRAYGDEMESLFVEQIARTSGVDRLRLWSRAFGDAARHGLGERLDQVRTRPRRVARRWWMDTLRHDVRYAYRLLLRQPGTAATILLTLALGIGANTAVFSVVHAVLVRPLPYANPHELVMVWEKRAAEGVDDNVVSPADFLDWARMNNSFAAIAGYSGGTADLTGIGEPVQLPIGGVTAAFFDVLGVRPVLGRTFAAGHDVLGQHRVVVIGHGLWQQRFGGDPAVVGKTLTLNGVPQQIIGVLPLRVSRRNAGDLGTGGVAGWGGSAAASFPPLERLRAPEAGVHARRGAV